MIYDSGVLNMQKRTSETLKLQQQIATNKRILVPSDDPVAAAQALEVTQAKTLNDLYTTNQANANDTMALSEGQLHAANDLLQTMHERIVQLANAPLSDTDRKSITTELRQSFEQLQGIANQQDGTGNYLFSGFRGDTKPFTGTLDTGVVYNGDQGTRSLQVSPSRNMQVSESGRDIFMAIPDDSTPFTIGTDSQNVGTGVIGSPKITDATKWNDILNPKNFTIHFAVSGGVTTYDVVDDTGISLLTNNPSAITTPPVVPPLPGTYVQGTPIDLKALPATVGGMDFGASVMITGSPSNGDTFSIRPSGPVSVFDSLSDLVHASEVTLDGVSGGANRDTFNAQVQSTLANILSAQDNIDKYRSQIGARMTELDSLTSASSQRDLDYQSTLSRLQDIDPTKAISDLTRTTTTLQAAQLSFNKITQLSLFNYL
jgi:flagellar hook-associated protein 3 FlgL